MLFERIEAPELAHFSYLVGAGGDAVVIDPRRDSDVYVEQAEAAGQRIRYVLETHRNEDYVSGALELQARVGAAVWHADGHLPYGYGEPVADGQRWTLGPLAIEAIHTPGHTPGSMSYLLRDAAGAPWALFSGDTLLAGSVGRTDLGGEDTAPEMTRQLYESITRRILPLGDEVVLCPAHGRGSACGASIADRPVTTIGLERRHNPMLSHADVESFVREAGRALARPPYFDEMERVNVAGPPLLGAPPVPVRLTAAEVEDAQARGAQVLDTRDALAFASAHLPGSFFVPHDMLGAFAGWYLRHEKPTVLVTADGGSEDVVRALLRMGYDDLAGRLAGGMLAWHTAGKESAEVDAVLVQRLCHRLDAGDELHILDVRTHGELDSLGRVPGAQHIPVTELPGRLGEVPADVTVHVFCGSGQRSMIGASLLEAAGRDRVAVILGGFEGWTSDRCPIERP